MKNKLSAFSVCFILVLLIFVVLTAWYLPTASSLRLKLEDTALSLETSRGRESKQQYEYDNVVSQIPVVKQELAEKAPLAEQAQAKVDELKARRKELKAEKQTLEEILSSREGTSNE